MFNLDDITNKQTTKNIMKNGHTCQITGTECKNKTFK